MTHSHRIRIFAALFVMGLSCAGRAGSREEVFFDSTAMKKGPRSVENIRNNIELILPRIYYLYSEALGPDSTLAGVLTIRMEVDRRGKPGFVDVHESTLDNETLHNLILAGLVESRFDQWKNGRGLTEILFPLVLTPDKASDAPKSRARRVFEERQKIKAPTRSDAGEADTTDEWQ